MSLRTVIEGRAPLAIQCVIWADGSLPLEVSFYVADEPPSLEYVTSVRCIVFRGEEVLVVRDPDCTHITPGGRREEGESLEETLRREVLEETGWTLADPVLLGFLYYRHLGPKPPGYRYPYPEFTQVVYVAEALTSVPAARTSDWEQASFVPVAEAHTHHLSPYDSLLLDAALVRRSRGENTTV